MLKVLAAFWATLVLLFALRSINESWESRFLHYGLAIDPLADEEVEMQRRYLEIERMCFTHRLVVSIMVDPAVRNAWIPSLLLQPLVENAIKHGVATTSAPVVDQTRAAPLFGRCLSWVERPVSAAG